MYAFIEGEVCEKLNGSLVLLASGVGWQLNCSNNTLQAAPPLGEKMRCWTYLSVREDAMELFGFHSREEKRMYERLRAVNGVGSRIALQILSSMSVRDLALALVAGDADALTRVPGIGKKTAQRLVLELKDKVDDEALTGQGVRAVGKASANTPESEAIAALISLGYASSEAAQAVARVAGQTDKTDELIFLALKGMGGI